MCNYSKFNENLESKLKFRMSSDIFDILQGQGLPSWAEECGFVPYEPTWVKKYKGCKIPILSEWDKASGFIQNDSLYSCYSEFCGYLSEIIKEYKKCENANEIVPFFKNVDRMNDMVYKYCLEQNEQEFNDLLQELEKNAEMLRNNNSEKYKIISKYLNFQNTVSEFLLHKACIDEYFKFDHYNKTDISTIGEIGIKIITENLDKVKYDTLLKIIELIDNFKDKHVCFPEDDNKALNEIKNLIDNSIQLYTRFYEFVNGVKLDSADINNITDEEAANLLLEAFSCKKLENTHAYYEQINGFINLLGDHQNFETIRNIWKKTEFYNEFVKDGLEDKALTEIKRREDDYVRSIMLLSNDCSDDEKQTILKEFFELGYNNPRCNIDPKESNSYQNIRNNVFEGYSSKDIAIKRAIEKIWHNKQLVNQLVSGEHLFRKIAAVAKNEHKELASDYTFFVTAQIKAVERYIKEAILRNMSGEKFTNDKFFVTLPNPNMTLDIFAKQAANIKFGWVFTTAGLGALNIFLTSCLKNESKCEKIFSNKVIETNSIFHAGDDENTLFKLNFVDAVRNGHFHTSVIESFSEAQEIRENTAFWLLCVITELKRL